MSVTQQSEIVYLSVGCHTEDDLSLKVDFDYDYINDEIKLNDVWVMHSGGEAHANYLIEYAKKDIIEQLEAIEDSI